MDFETLRHYCLSKPGATEDMPFDDETLVFKIFGKMFALLSIEEPPAINLKCNPEKALELRERYSEITPGYHMNKVHWNTVIPGAGITPGLVMELIDHSYDLVLSGLPLKHRKSLENPNKA